MTTPTSQDFESFVPVYDAMPEDWEEAREFLVEQLKMMSNGINIREIGWYLDVELLSGKAFIPSATASTTETPEQYRTVLRKVIDTGALVIGANAGVPHEIVFDDNFTLVALYVVATNSIALQARQISGNDVIMNATNILITSPAVFDRSFCVIEYIQEI